jgi:hypothetical protein
MGKSRQRNVAKSTSSAPEQPGKRKEIHVSLSTSERFVWQWMYHERQGLLWVLGCAFIGALLGFGIGTGHLTGSVGAPAAAWRVALGSRVRSWRVYQFSRKLRPSSWSTSKLRHLVDLNLQQDPSHPRIFAILREAIVREPEGYVHPDLGFLVPAPTGAARGVGMVAKTYHECQTRCMPGIAAEKEKLMGVENPEYVSNSDDPIYKQEEVLVRLPLAYQMTRQGALSTLTALIPPEVLLKFPITDLDDAALLVLFLAHERGMSRASKWLPYIASLPKEPMCGYSLKLRPQLLDSLAALSDQLGLEVQGWPTELSKAERYADRIATALAKDYGNYLRVPSTTTMFENLQWALCQVASRATAGSEKHGALRLLPLLDQLNHDATAGSFVELTGTERLKDGDFLETTELDSGSFVIRTLRHGRRRALKVGQELTVNYNVPHYTPLDWFISMGFVPPERWAPWVKVDPVLPRVRKDGPFNAEEKIPNSDWLKVAFSNGGE